MYIYCSSAGILELTASNWFLGRGFVSTTGYLPPRKAIVPTSRLFINHSGVVLWSNHANLVRGSTSHLVRDVELEEKDTGGEKYEVQLDDLTDRGRGMADLTSEAKVPVLPVNSTCCCDIYQHACYMCATLLIGYHAILITWLILWKKEASE